MNELNVKVGDKLIYQWGYSYNRVETVATVTKVTPTGRIRVDCSEKQYDKYGNELGKHGVWYCRSMLSEITEEDVKRIKENNAIKKAFKLANSLKITDIDYQKALKIIELLKE